jgi:hypothetical protein
MIGSILISLEEDRTSGNERSISCNSKLPGRIRVSEDRLP